MIGLLDEGRPCPGPLGGAWHEAISIDGGRRWVRGSRFYVLDNHGVPRPVKFMYHYTGSGATVCYSLQRFRLPDGQRMPCGFVTRLPGGPAITRSPRELQVMQLASDLMELRLTALAVELLDALDGNDDDLDEAISAATKVIESWESGDSDDS